MSGTIYAGDAGPAVMPVADAARTHPRQDSLTAAPAPRGGAQRSGRGLVRREWLFDRFASTAPGGVILVCAPAGSGKTELLRSWIESAGPDARAAWVSVDRGERDAQRFWRSVVDALACVVPTVARIDPAPSFRGDVLVQGLAADLRSLDEPAVLVVDDLHELHSTDALRWLEHFLTALPAQLRVVLATREDPRLGLHRLRLAGGLTELRAGDLRFSMQETRELLDGAGIELSEGGAALLHERTEGWAAGLRLAAISLAEHPDPERFVREFTGSERTVAGYLMEEVLGRQPPEVRDLLLRTSIVERVSGPLADHLTGAAGSERILQELEDANAFVTSLDAGRTWFRYHHLFADLLRLELRRAAPGVVRSLHAAAARWFAEEGDVVAAIRHAQAAGAWSQAGGLLFENRIALILDGRLATVRALLDGFPDHVATSDPEVALTFAGVRIREGVLDEADAYVAIAERHADTVAPERQGLFDLELASIRVALAQQRADLAGALEAMTALDAALGAQCPSEIARSNDIRALALMSLGITELWALRLKDARRHLEQGLALSRRIGRPYLEIGCLAHLGIAAPLSDGSPSMALDFTEEAVRLAERHGLVTDPVVTLAFAVSGGSLAWLGRFEEAGRRLEGAERALRPEEDPGSELALHHARGLLRFGEGRFEEALAALRSAAALQDRLEGEHALMADVRLRIPLVLLRMGDTAAARAAVGAVPEGERDRAEAQIAAGAVALAEGDAQGATAALAPVIARSLRTLNPTWAAIHALLYDAAARDELGDHRATEASVEEALALAEPEGLILPFVIAPVQGLLERHPRYRSAHGALVTAILDVIAGTGTASSGAHAAASEDLSDAELRVVRYLASNLKASEIAAELCVSTNTVRTHLRHIYAKLDAHGRTEAVSRARELRLLAPRAR